MLNKIAIIGAALFSTATFALAEENVTYHEGMPFPKFTSSSADSASARIGGTPSGDWFCAPFERHKFTNQASINIRSKKIKTASSSYTAPHYWSIEAVTRIEDQVERFYNGSVQQAQPNQSTLTRSEYNDIYNNVHRYLLEFDLPSDIEGKIDLQLNDFVQSYIYLSDFLSSTHGAAIHRGEAGRRGIFRAWSVYKAHLDIDVVCNTPEATSAAAAESTLRRWVEQEASKYSDVGGGGQNKALSADISAVSTFPGYSVYNINDGDNNTRLGPNDSWANNSGSSPSIQEIVLSWPREISFSKVTLYTSSGYELSDYQIQYLSSGRWIDIANIYGNTSTVRSHSLTGEASTTKIRVLPKKGPSKQTFYVRINELEVE